ncbi:hypothetical protein ACFPRL_19840 [Pseudoclavibacter helvolus]
MRPRRRCPCGRRERWSSRWSLAGSSRRGHSSGCSPGRPFSASSPSSSTSATRAASSPRPEVRRLRIEALPSLVP